MFLCAGSPDCDWSNLQERKGERNQKNEPASETQREEESKVNRAEVTRSRARAELKCAMGACLRWRAPGGSTREPSVRPPARSFIISAAASQLAQCGRAKAPGRQNLKSVNTRDKVEMICGPALKCLPTFVSAICMRVSLAVNGQASGLFGFRRRRERSKNKEMKRNLPNTHLAALTRRARLTETDEFALELLGSFGSATKSKQWPLGIGDFVEKEASGRGAESEPSRQLACAR